MLFRRRQTLAPPAREALARVLAAPDVRARAAQERARPGRVPAARARPSRSRRRRRRGSRRPSPSASSSRPAASGPSRTCRRGWSATGPTSPSSSPGWRAPASTAPSWSAATRRSPGEFPDGLSLLRAMAEIGHPLREIGIPCYPQGHAFIADRLLLDALRDKARYASYMTTQLCFDPGAIATWLAARRAEGIAPARPRRHPGRRRAAQAARDQRPDRRRRHPPVPHEEHPVRRAADAVAAASTGRTACSRAWRRTSPIRRRGSSTSTCTRSTRSRRPRSGAGRCWSAWRADRRPAGATLAQSLHLRHHLRTTE